MQFILIAHFSRRQILIVNFLNLFILVESSTIFQAECSDIVIIFRRKNAKTSRGAFHSQQQFYFDRNAKHLNNFLLLGLQFDESHNMISKHKRNHCIFLDIWIHGEATGDIFKLKGWYSEGSGSVLSSTITKFKPNENSIFGRNVDDLC